MVLISIYTDFYYFHYINTTIIWRGIKMFFFFPGNWRELRAIALERCPNSPSDTLDVSDNKRNYDGDYVPLDLSIFTHAAVEFSCVLKAAEPFAMNLFSTWPCANFTTVRIRDAVIFADEWPVREYPNFCMWLLNTLEYETPTIDISSVRHWENALPTESFGYFRRVSFGQYEINKMTNFK